MGTIEVFDGCGRIGSVSTSPFIAVAAEHLSTVSFADYTSGQEFVFGEATMYNRGATSKRLDIVDLECPTFGLAKSTDRNGANHFTVGYPWLPMIVRPEEVLAYDPVWNSSCRWIPSGWWNVQSAALFDPPHASVPGEGLVSGPTGGAPTAPTPVGQFTEALKPQSAQKPTPNQPAPTGDFTNWSEGESKPPSAPMQDPSSPGSPSAPDSPSDPKIPIQNQPQAGDRESAPADWSSPGQNAGSDSGSGPNTAGQGSMNAPPGKDSDPGTQVDSHIDQNDPFTQGDTGKGVVNHQNQAPNGGSEVSSHANSLPVAAPVYTVGNQIFAPNPTGFQVAGSSIMPGGPGISLAGTVLSLASSGNLVIGDKTFAVADPSNLATSKDPNRQNNAGAQQNAPSGHSTSPDSGNRAPVYTIADQTIIPNPTGFRVPGGKTLLPGGPAITISGTAIFLAPSGTALVIGDKTINAINPSKFPDLNSPNKPGSSPIEEANADAPILTLGSQTVTPNPNGFSISPGTTIKPGSPAITISNTRISLGPSGLLFINDQTVSLSTPTTTLTPTNLAISNSKDAYSPPITIAGQIITPNPQGFVVDGSTIMPGGDAVVIDGTSVSLARDGVLDVGGSMTTLVDGVRKTGTSSGGGGEGGAEAFTGKAGRVQVYDWKVLVAFVVLSVVELGW